MRKTIKRCISVLTLTLMVVFEITGGVYAIAEAMKWPGWLEEGTLEHSLRIQTSLVHTNVSTGSANPGNLAALAKREAALEFRPNLYYGQDDFDISVKPRITASQSWIDSELAGDNKETDTEAFVNEWRIRWLGWNDWSASYGREVLLWGPAYSINPSNPFYIDAGRSNPYRELGGQDFATVSWIGSNGWTVNYYENVDEGRHALPISDSFHRTRAIKLDKSTYDTYWSVNYAWRESDANRLGFSFQATVSDSVLTYVEMGLHDEVSQLTPIQDSSGFWKFEKPDDGGWQGIGLLGLAKTFEFGPTLNIEYLYNSQGWSNKEAEDVKYLLDSNADALRVATVMTPAAEQLAVVSHPGSVLHRRHYLFAQYLHNDMLNNLDLTWRFTHNLDDQSTRWILNLDRTVGDRLRFFILMSANTGPEYSEATLYIENSLFLGLRWSL